MPSNYVGARTIEELAAALQKLSYTPRTEEQRRTQAETFFQNQLNQELLNAQQKYEESDLALANQLASLGTSYDRQARAIEKNTRAAVSAADRNALSRGMQRSSFNLSRMANIQNQGNQQLSDMEQNRTDTENAIAEQRGLAARQYAQNTANARSQYEGNVLARMLELEDQDYQRQLAADQFNSNTQLQLYSAQQADAQREQQQAQFEAGQGLTREQMAQNQNQFDLNLQLQRDELAEKIRQFNEQMAYNRERAAAASAGSSGGSSSYVPKQNPDTNPSAKDRDYGNGTTSTASTSQNYIAPINSTTIQQLTAQLAGALNRSNIESVAKVTPGQAAAAATASQNAALAASNKSPLLTPAQSAAAKKSTQPTVGAVYNTVTKKKLN